MNDCYYCRNQLPHTSAVCEHAEELADIIRNEQEIRRWAARVRAWISCAFWGLFVFIVLGLVGLLLGGAYGT